MLLQMTCRQHRLNAALLPGSAPILGEPSGPGSESQHAARPTWRYQPLQVFGLHLVPGAAPELTHTYNRKEVVKNTHQPLRFESELPSTLLTADSVIPPAPKQ